jgi:hypothetical protein
MEDNCWMQKLGWSTSGLDSKWVVLCIFSESYDYLLEDDFVV